MTEELKIIDFLKNLETGDEKNYLCAKRAKATIKTSTMADDKGECPSGTTPCSSKTTGMNTICLP